MEPVVPTLGVSQTVIGLTIVSAGTGMPELVTSLVSVYRGRTDWPSAMGGQPDESAVDSWCLCLGHGNGGGR